MLMTYFIDNTLDTKHHHNIKVVLLVFYIILGLINARKMEHIRKIEFFFFQEDRPKGLQSTTLNNVRSLQRIFCTADPKSERNHKNSSLIRFLNSSAEGNGAVSFKWLTRSLLPGA